MRQWLLAHLRRSATVVMRGRARRGEGAAPRETRGNQTSAGLVGAGRHRWAGLPYEGLGAGREAGEGGAAAFAPAADPPEDLSLIHI